MDTSSEQRRKQRKQSRRARRRAEIIDVAEALSREHGPDGFTTEAIAEALGISQASVFYYFSGGRPELMAALALRQQHRWLDDAAEIARSAPSGVEALARITRHMRDLHVSQPEQVEAVQDALVSAEWGPDLLGEHVNKMNATYDLLEQRLEEDRAAGLLHPEITNLRRWAMMTMHLPFGHIMVRRMQRMAGGRSLHSDLDLLEDLLTLLRRGSTTP